MHTTTKPTAPAFTVSAAKLSVSERFLIINYTQCDNDRPLDTQIDAKRFEHYLQCMHDVDCPSLVEWMLHVPKEDLHARLAAFMECLMWEAYEESINRQQEENINPC